MTGMMEEEWRIATAPNDVLEALETLIYLRQQNEVLSVTVHILLMVTSGLREQI